MNKKFTINIIVFMFLLLFPSLLISQSNQQDLSIEDLFEMSLEDLKNVEIISVSKKAENVLKTPATVIIITDKQIRQRGYLDLEQLLHDLPGFDISRGNGTAYSQIYQRGYRSNNTDRTLLLIDGVEENDLWKGNVWLSRQYSISNIKRVEVVYGPASTMYGANAFVGVINVVTKDGSDILGEDQTWGINAQINYGYWNTRYADITFAGKYEKIFLSVTGRFYQSDEMDLSGYSDWDYDLDAYDRQYYKNKLGTNSDSLADRAKQLDQAYYTDISKIGNTKPVYSNNTDDYYFYGKLKVEDFVFGFQTWRRDEGYGAWYRDDYESGPENGGKWVPANTFLYAKYDKEINESLSISSFTRYKSHMLDGESQENYFVGYINGEYGLADLTDSTGSAQPYWDVIWWHVLSKQLRSELKISYDFSENVNLISGFEYRNSYIQGTYVESSSEDPSETGFPRDKAGTGLPGGNHYDNRDIGFYSQMKISLNEDLNLIIGGRLDNNKIRESGGYGTVFNPKLAAIYTPGKFIGKIIYSSAFKDADNWTKFSTTSGRLLPNPGLKPEKVKNIEFNIGCKTTENMFVDLAAYHANYSDVVGTATVDYEGGNTTQHQPMGSLAIQGVQLRIDYKYQNYNTYFNYTFTNPQNTEGDEDVRIGDIASHQINFGVNALFIKKLNVNLRANYVGEKETGQNTTISANPFDKIDSYFVLNSTITYNNLIKGVTPQLIINNLLDIEYFHPGVRSAGGDYYGSRLPQNERNIMFRVFLDI